VAAAGETLRADYAVIACGGCAGGKVGGVKDGYELLGALGHARTALYPALAPITTAPEYPRAMKGVRADAALRLEGAACGESAGEIQFTEKGVSGPAAFDLCRAVSASGDGRKELHINFLRGFSAGEIDSLLANRRDGSPTLPAEELFTGVLHNRVGRMIVKYAGIDGAKPMSAVTDAEICSAARSAADFVLPVRGTEGFDQAQVTAGGMDVSQFDPRSLESRLVPHLYACGEVLDVDGRCGGFNLQWAWASGILAGRLSR
jgi:predicted Rossmann fold flavoprotein